MAEIHAVHAHNRRIRICIQRIEQFNYEYEYEYSARSSILKFTRS